MPKYTTQQDRGIQIDIDMPEMGLVQKHPLQHEKGSMCSHGNEIGADYVTMDVCTQQKWQYYRDE